MKNKIIEIHTKVLTVVGLKEASIIFKYIFV